MASPFSNLPADAITRIFSFLTEGSRFRPRYPAHLALIDRHWRPIVQARLFSVIRPKALTFTRFLALKDILSHTTNAQLITYLPQVMLVKWAQPATVKELKERHERWWTNLLEMWQELEVASLLKLSLKLAPTQRGYEDESEEDEDDGDAVVIDLSEQADLPVLHDVVGMELDLTGEMDKLFIAPTSVGLLIKAAGKDLQLLAITIVEVCPSRNLRQDFCHGMLAMISSLPENITSLTLNYASYKTCHRASPRLYSHFAVGGIDEFSRALRILSKRLVKLNLGQVRTSVEFFSQHQFDGEPELWSNLKELLITFEETDAFGEWWADWMPRQPDEDEDDHDDQDSITSNDLEMDDNGNVVKIPVDAAEEENEVLDNDAIDDGRGDDSTDRRYPRVKPKQEMLAAYARAAATAVLRMPKIEYLKISHINRDLFSFVFMRGPSQPTLLQYQDGSERVYKAGEKGRPRFAMPEDIVDIWKDNFDNLQLQTI